MTLDLNRLAIVAALGLSTIVSQGGCRKAADDETTPVMTVDVAPVLLSQIDRTIRADGVLYPRQQAAIVPKITAPIRRVHAQRGTRVKAGQVLVELENGDLAGAAAENRAALAAADAAYETASKATVPEELQKAELDVEAAKDALDAQQAVLTNRQRLLKEGAVAQKDVNDAQAAVSQARAQYETARRRLADLQGFARDQALKAASAQRDAAQARHDAAQAQLSYTRLTSPIDGVVTDLPYYPGETPPSGQPLVTVMDVAHVIARVHVTPADAAELRVGNQAHLVAPNGAQTSAKVTQISPALDAQNTTVEVWVEAENPDGRLRPGVSMKVEMVAKHLAQALVIPQKAVLTSPSGATFVIVIDQDDKPHRRKIAVGIRDSGKVEVTDGLESGQRVATTGAFELFKLDDEVLGKTKVQVAPAAEEEEPEET